MKRFIFPLERVRKWREDQAGVEEEKLQKLYAELRGVEESRRALGEHEENCQRSVLRGEEVAALDLAVLDSFRCHIARRQTELKGREKKIEGQIIRQREALLAARRGFRLLDRLRGREFATWTAASDKETESLAAELHLATRSREMHRGE